MKALLKKFITKLCTFVSLRRGVTFGKDVKCNFLCHFTENTNIGTNCHFNGMRISGSGKVTIGDNFHSGKNIHVITSFHNYEGGNALPYDATYCHKDVTIGDNVWLGESVMILGGVTIGEGAVIQAGSVVCKSVPPLAIAGGHPAVPFKYRNKEHYEELKRLGRYT